jgi:tetratricopeptide (TPR) repeat protein
LYKGFYYFWLGSFEQSQQELQVAADFYKIVDNEHGLGYINWARGWIYFYMGDMINGRKHFSNWFESPIHYSPPVPSCKAEFSFYFGLNDVKEDNLDTAKSRLAEIQALLPDIDPDNREHILNYYKIFKAELLLSQDSIEKALNISKGISPLQLPPISPRNLISYNLPFPLLRDLLARAYHCYGNINKAIAEYENLITFNPESKERRLIHPTYYFKLAKLYEKNGQLVKAVEMYQKFLNIWKKADDELPEILDAKDRLNGLRRRN